VIDRHLFSSHRTPTCAASDQCQRLPMCARHCRRCSGVSGAAMVRGTCDGNVSGSRSADGPIGSPHSRAPERGAYVFVCECFGGDWLEMSRIKRKRSLR
jgi:hypothetical protein